MYNSVFHLGNLSRFIAYVFSEDYYSCDEIRFNDRKTGSWWRVYVRSKHLLETVLLTNIDLCIYMKVTFYYFDFTQLSLISLSYKQFDLLNVLNEPTH